MTTLAATESTNESTTESAPAGHRFTLLVTDGTDGLTKVLTTLRSRRYAVCELRADLSGDVGRVEVGVEPDGRDPQLLLEQLRRVIAVVRAEHG
ncbi:ACT domain-containing protein [Pseudonocardia parietis]|jgi:acetolactate synthase regulatory subunit|uniref:Acetolactate synthase regulatory subunit n=1 Tax=Pseudonocardia parietis TaxID=570936 RepID=A0ABS4VS95_9PSEU|nr:ACT domain-containing protein [Pseudonocardia parietis]MBP2366593.1 acetolactate synthase regulatory subunit [Pseudonocardia parietis]